MTTTRRSSQDRRPGKTDWDRVDRLTDAEIEAAIAADPDVAPILDRAWFERAEIRIGNRVIRKARRKPV